MAVVRTAVLLIGFNTGQQLELPDVSEYQLYFFNSWFGRSQGSYWAKQSDNAVVLQGDVFDWAFVNDPKPDLRREANVSTFAVKVAEGRGMDFAPYDLVIVVIGAPLATSSWGGRQTARSSWRNHPAVVMRVGDPFDFVAHEIGHALGLHHSFGDVRFKPAWGEPGEYGHPYCVMSAMTYGLKGLPFDSKGPEQSRRRDYNGLGPSINAATALARGWMDAHGYVLGRAGHADFVVRGRGWGGRNRHLAPQAVDVQAPDGQNYVLEYRLNDGWDKGQDTSLLIINHGRGSTADREHPGTNSATYLGAIPIPITFGSHNSTFDGPGFGVEVLDRSFAHQTLTIRVSPGRAPRTPLLLGSAVEMLDEAVVGTGQTNFEFGDQLCVQGQWSYNMISTWQRLTITATFALDAAPIRSTWSVDGITCNSRGGELTLPNKAVRTVDGRLRTVRDNRTVHLRYEVAALPHGSQLMLYNNPDDETFSVDVSATLSTDVGSGTTDALFTLTGFRYQFPRAFHEERHACIRNLGRIGDRFREYVVLLPPHVWRGVPQERHAEVEQLRELLGELRCREDQGVYGLALSLLEERFGIDPSEARVVWLLQDPPLTSPPTVCDMPAPEPGSDPQ